MSVMRLRYAVLGVTLSFGLGATARATPVITVGTVTTVANGGTAPGSSTDYDFSDFGGSALGKNLTNVTFTPIPFGSPAGGTSLIAPGGSVAAQTSILDTGSFTPSGFGSFTTTMTDFTLYVLVDNGAYSDDLVDLDGLANHVFLGGTFTNTNEFVSFQVTGATSTDVFRIGTEGTLAVGNNTSMGGITFTDNTPVASATPEPSSIVLLGTGVLGVVGAGRRRRMAGR
jgi:hypothetical protein